MSIDVEILGSVAVLRVAGRLVVGNGDDLLRRTVERLLREGKTKIIVDLSACPYADSIGFGEIVRSYAAVGRQRGGFRLVAPTPRVQRALDTMKISDVLGICTNQEEAIASLATR